MSWSHRSLDTSGLLIEMWRRVSYILLEEVFPSSMNSCCFFLSFTLTPFFLPVNTEAPSDGTPASDPHSSLSLPISWLSMSNMASEVAPLWCSRRFWTDGNFVWTWASDTYWTKMTNCSITAMLRHGRKRTITICNGFHYYRIYPCISRIRR